MELEFKCRIQDCNFSSAVDWPETTSMDGSPTLDTHLTKVTEMTRHHTRTRPKAEGENLYLAGGHSSFTTVFKGNKLVIDVSGMSHVITEGVSKLKLG